MSSEKLGMPRFSNARGLLAQKEKEPQRILCACFLARQMVWHLIDDPQCRELIEVAEEYARGNKSKEELKQANKLARIWDNLPKEWTWASESHRMAKSIAFAVTWRSCDVSFNSVGERIVDSLTYEYLATHPGSEWPEAEEMVRDAAWGRMADLIHEFAEPSAEKTECQPESRIYRPLGATPELAKYRIKNGEHYDPYVIRDWVLANVSDAAQKQALLGAIDCFYEVAPRPNFSASDLAPIQKIAMSPNRIQRETAVALLKVLGLHHVAAQEVLLELLNAKKVEVRFTMITHFENPALPFPMDFVIRVIDKGFRDVSAKVREFAACAVLSCRDRQGILANLPLLIEHYKQEKSEKVKWTFLYSILQLGVHEIRETPEHTFALFEKKKEPGQAGLMICETGLASTFFGANSIFNEFVKK